MSDHHLHSAESERNRNTDASAGASQDAAGIHDKHGGSHGWMMIACCIPMLVIAVALVASGTARPGFLVAALVCTGAMALMMGGMGHGDRHQDNDMTRPPSKFRR